jgi:serine/threonine-protein kinase
MTNNLSMIFAADVSGEPPQDFSNEYRKYHQFRALGSGGKADLVVCKDTNLGRPVVLKKLRNDVANYEKELSRLLREARITAQLQHPATVPLYEIGKDDEDNWYFAMKKIEGQTLFEVIVGLYNREPTIEKRFNLTRLLDIFRQVCDALSYAHARGVIHRDIKPENIIIGMFGEVTLIDWGVAKVWGMPNEGDEQKGVDRGGTPLYMSPEQILGHKPVDERTDVFSMGIVLYEMMTQREPFRGPTIQDTFNNIINSDPMPPRKAAAHRFIPATMESICLKAIEKDPADRFQSMDQMAEEINKFQNEALMRGSV